MTYISKIFLFFMSLQLSIISCRGALRHKEVEGSSSRLMNNETKHMAFPLFQLETGALIRGIMLNSDTVLVQHLDWSKEALDLNWRDTMLLGPLDPSMGAPETLAVSEASSIGKGQKAIRFRGVMKEKRDVEEFDFGRTH